MEFELTDKVIENLKDEYEKILKVEWHPTVFYLLDAIAYEAQKELVKDIALHITEAIAVKDSDSFKEMTIRAMPEDYWQSVLKHFELEGDEEEHTSALHEAQKARKKRRDLSTNQLKK